jgi:hypothetical protein
MDRSCQVIYSEAYHWYLVVILLWGMGRWGLLYVLLYKNAFELSWPLKIFENFDPQFFSSIDYP